MIDGKLNVLFAASECTPLAKTGGLADVVGALPSALSKHSITSSTIIPFYSALPEDIVKKSELIAEFNIKLGWKNQYAGLLRVKHNDRTYYFIDNQEYFYRDELYSYFDDSERFIFFSLAVLKSLEYIKDVDIIHCHDWQTALISTGLKHLYYGQEYYKDIKTVYTIHNLRHQGKLQMTDFVDMTGIDGYEYWLSEVEHQGLANLMKAGLYHSDAVTTVSPNYANEIKYSYYGESMEGCINEIDYKLHGILNGIDSELFNPSTDSKIYLPYTDLEGKSKNKKSFYEEFHIEENDNMLIGIVTRLDKQKGLDLVTYAIDEIMDLPVNFVLLGTGDKDYEGIFADVENKYKDRVRCFIMYSDELARKIYASSDVFLMPSMFEPCGLGQLIAMRYGTLPIVRETGGLSDTVTAYNIITGEGTGFSFANFNGQEMIEAIKKANDLYTNNRGEFDKIAMQDMYLDFSWDSSSKKYKELYMNILKS